MPGDDLSAVLTDVTGARGLPNRHYVSDAWFDIEREELLFDNWAGLCFGKDVPAPGDALPLSFVGMPLLVVRDRAGAVRAFQNTCRHRGMILVDEPRNVGSVIRCPYHSWCYALDGTLKATPHVGGPGLNTHAAIEPASLGLFEIPCHIWRDVVFVNVNGNAAPFADYAAAAIDRWREFEDQPLYHGGADSGFTFDVACNWKLAVENYCESYHLPWVHPGLNSYSRLEDHYNIEATSFSGQGTRVYQPMITEDGRRFPDFHGLSSSWEAGAEYIALYPNVLLAAHRDHAYAMILTPLSNDRTIERVEIYYATPETTGSDWAPKRSNNAKLWHDVLAEDIAVVEGMQRGRLGKHFDGGRFSPAMDGPTHCFHRWVAQRLQAAASDAASN